MSTSVMQFRIDDELKKQAVDICDNLGIDFPTALRMFVKRMVSVKGIPFDVVVVSQKSNNGDNIEMTDDEKINFVAQRILREHKAAFEELAK